MSNNTSAPQWFEKPVLLGLLTLVLPLIALVGIYLNKALDFKIRAVLAIAALANFLGQSAMIVMYFIKSSA